MQRIGIVARKREETPLVHHECLGPPLRCAIGVGYHFVAGQRGEGGEEGRVDERGEREVLKKRNSKMYQSIHWEVGAYRGGGERSLPIKWHDVRS